MALDGVPWFIGGEAEHGPDVARQLLYAATGGKQGVSGPGDLKATALDVPGAGVKIAAGGGTILNRVASQQSYGVRNPTADAESVKVAATGSSGKRSDIVICRVDNPYVDGNAQMPADPVHGPYDKFDIISGVPAGTRRLQELADYKGLSAIEICRIDLPANTGTVTSAMITDLRQLTSPRSESFTLTDFGVSTATLSQTAGTIFPPYRPTVTVPDWANFARVELVAAGLSALGNSTGVYNVQLQDAAGVSAVSGNSIGYNADAVVTSTRMTLLGFAEGNVAAYRGQELRPTTMMRKTDAGQANVKYDASSQMLYRVTFSERLA